MKQTPEEFLVDALTDLISKLKKLTYRKEIFDVIVTELDAILSRYVGYKKERTAKKIKTRNFL